MRRPEGPRFTRRPKPKPKEGERAPSTHGNLLRIIPIGGNEETGGRNCYVIQFGQDILVVDCGLMFPEDDMPGVDYIIPDLSYLKGKEKWIRGVVITHGHLDHIGGVAHWIPRLGNPPIYSSNLTCALIEKKAEDVAPRHKFRFNPVKNLDRVRLGQFRLQFFGLSHSIPAALGIVIETPGGTIVHTGDFKMDQQAHVYNRTDIEFVRTLGNRNIACLMCDSTNAIVPGHQLSEEEVQKNIQQMFTQTKGRLIIATMSTLLSRIQQILSLAEQYHRKVHVVGYSMRANVEIAVKLGYVRIKPDTLVTWEQAKNLPNNRYMILCTGTQGEDNAALMRIANREDKNIRVEKDDLVVFSSSVIPGNERAVTRLKEGLLREGADIIDSKVLDIHAGGHAKAEDIRDFIQLVRPKYFMPIEGSYSFLLQNKKIALAAGVSESNILIADNGQIVEFDKGQGYVTNQRIPIDYVFVDGAGIGDVNAIVLRDRKQLAGDGMVIVVAQVNRRTGKVGKVDIISRGLTHMKEQGRLISDMVRETKKALADKEPRVRPDDKDLREKIRHHLEKFLFQRTHRQPMIIPVIIET